MGKPLHPPHNCPCGCGEQISWRFLMCPRAWREDVPRELRRAHSANGRASKADRGDRTKYLAVRETAFQCIAQAQVMKRHRLAGAKAELALKIPGAPPEVLSLIAREMAEDAEAAANG